MKRLFISADMEGIGGVVSKEQCSTDGFEFQKAREWMTQEVVAVCETASDCGFDEIVVADSHSTGQNLLLDDLPQAVRVVRAWPRPLGMAQGIDSGTFAAAALIGYHSGATDIRGALAHTYSGLDVAELRINGKPCSETVLVALTAGKFGVPVALVSGDDAYVEHAQTVLDNVEGVVTKYWQSRLSTMTLTPAAARDALRVGARKAFNRLGDFKPMPQAAPYAFELRFRNRFRAEMLSFLPFVERLDANSIRFVAQDISDITRFMEFVFHGTRPAPP